MLTDKKGFTLTDIVIISILVMIMTVSGMAFYNSLQSRHWTITNRCTAINLACAQIEDLLAMEYDTVPHLNPGNRNTTLTSVPAGFTVSYAVQGARTDTIDSTSITYKSITVQVVDNHPQGITVQLTTQKVQS